MILVVINWCNYDFIMIADAMVSTGLAAAGYKYVNLGKDKTI